MPLVPVEYDPFVEPGQAPIPADLPDVVQRAIGFGQGIPEGVVPLGSEFLDPARHDLWTTEREAAWNQTPRDEPLRNWLGALRDRAAEGWPRDQGASGFEGSPPRATSISDVRLVPVDHDPFAMSNLLTGKVPILIPVDHDPFATGQTP